MGFLDNAKDAAEATGEKIGRAVEDTKERISDGAEERKAEADVKKAEADRDAVKAKNEYKEGLRD
ncbi:hypothetical protein [Homoserinibacter sp. YIM 151385]|uniref:hypothetical protein n=1 Tax=Homoserinibacter sp. YIM 151385 TaxID=2985506 RepID=UPI0022F0CD72|nr:hypothetical protein [Homoserinibacter sp. YIM 151385]WBU37953.1 hypothetical protein OF852_13715 [Homoserinibacter sp. YIM 151385]